MGVEFDWQLDVGDNWKTPRPEPPRRRIPRWAVALVLAALIGGAGVGVGRFWHGVRQGEESLKHDLASVANLEAQALRDGDAVTYLWLQDRYDTTWYARQKARVPAWGGEPLLEPGQAGHLAVMKAALVPSDGGAWAEVGWAQEDGIYRRAQFYRQVDGRWVRTGPDRTYFGPEEVHRTEHFSFKYPARDRSTVGWMAGQLEAWYAAICNDLGREAGGPINVLVTLDGETIRAYRPPRGLTISSPRLRGVRQDGAPTPEERAELAEMLVYLLVVRGADDLDATRQPYLLLEFVNWEMRRLGVADAETPPTPVLDLLMDSYGLEEIQALLAAMGRTNSEEEALRLALDLSLADLNDAFGDHLAAKLGVERQMVAWGEAEMVGPTSRPLARGLFGTLIADQSGAWRSEMYAAFSGWQLSYYPALSPSTHPHVDHWEWLDATTLWAEASYPDADGDPGGDLSRGPLRRIEFFGQVDGAWRHTGPDALFLGEELVLNSDHFRLVCHAREVEWMSDELARLESFYREITAKAEVELPPGERLTIRIAATATQSALHLDASAPEWRIPSPYFIGWHDDQSESYLVDWLAPSLLARLAFHAAGMEDPSGSFPSTRQIWLSSVLNAWGQQILGTDAPRVASWAPSVEPSKLAAKARSLDSMSALGRATFGSQPASYSWATDDWYTLYQQVFCVMHYIGEAYGREALLSLLQTLPEADSLESWLGPVLNVDLETLEAEWGMWLNEIANGNG